MELSSKEKFLLKNKYKNLSKNTNSKNLSNGTTLIILPDNDIAFDLAKLFFEKTESEITFLLKDSIVSFYPNEIISKCIQYSYKDMNSMGLPREVFIEKIQSCNFVKVSDLDIAFGRFGVYLSLFGSAKVTKDYK